MRIRKMDMFQTLSLNIHIIYPKKIVLCYKQNNLICKKGAYDEWDTSNLKCNLKTNKTEP